MSTKMLRCLNCGRLSPAGASYCRFCGEAVDPALIAELHGSMARSTISIPVSPVARARTRSPHSAMSTAPAILPRAARQPPRRPPRPSGPPP